MKKVTLRVLTLVLLLCTILQPLSVLAQEAVEVDRVCSLELDYANDGVGFPGLSIKIYRFAEIYEDGDYALVPPFDTVPVKIHGITSQAEWRDAASTLSAYILAEGIAPTAVAETGEDGKALFENLETGTYLVMGISAETEEGTYRFEPLCIFLPTPGEDGSQNYHIQARPKFTFTPKPVEPEWKDYRVLKLWKDEGNRTRRPRSITVDILRNGVVVETVTLNAANNWSYAWTAEDNGDVWSVVEKDVPDAYTVVISGNATTFTITNTCDLPDVDPPQTGDTFALKPWLTAMALSGILLLLLGILHKRKR